jgi:hypothetical protein
MLSRFWAADHGLSIFLGVLVVLVFVVAPVASPDRPGRLLVDAFFSLLLLAGVAAASESRRLLYLMAPVVLIALVVRWMNWFSPGGSMAEWNVASRLVVFALFCGVILARTFARGPVTMHRIQGAIAGYLLLGLAWANVYELLSLRLPGAFSNVSLVAASQQGWVYFSFVTLTTVGYGDMVPLHPLARSFANLEALTGQLYPAILLARLVSLEAQSR